MTCLPSAWPTCTCFQPQRIFIHSKPKAQERAGSVSSQTSPVPMLRECPAYLQEDIHRCQSKAISSQPNCNHHLGPREEGYPFYTNSKNKKCPPNHQFYFIMKNVTPRRSRKEVPKPQISVLVAKSLDRKTEEFITGGKSMELCTVFVSLSFFIVFVSLLD